MPEAAPPAEIALDAGAYAPGGLYRLRTKSDVLDDLQSSGKSAAFSLAPPRGYSPPAGDPALPAAAAGGYDLSFPAQRPETIESGHGARRVPLFSESWPVQVERKLFPAVSPEAAFLVAELKNPSKRMLPAGTARLFVGDDPTGDARLKLVAPGETFTLPLGLDRAIRPHRNVQLSQSERGFIGKDDVGEYTVTNEFANPYPFPIQVRLFDQWPLSSDKDVESTLLKTEPLARQDKVKGTLEWVLTVPASQKQSVVFSYRLRRPKGHRLYQQEGSAP